jgi:TniQ
MSSKTGPRRVQLVSARTTSIRHPARDSTSQTPFAAQSLGKYTLLFPLPIYGAGTAMVESLPSYLYRLSGAHGLPITTFFNHTLLPAMGGDYSAHSCGYLLAGRKGTRLLFPTKVSLDLIKILPQLTGQSSFDECILIKLQKAFSFESSARGVGSWCPLCLEQWVNEHKPVFFPTIWNIAPYRICTEHQVHLLTACPRCALCYPLVWRNVWTIECRRCGVPQIGAMASANSRATVDPSNRDWQTSIPTKELLAWAAMKTEFPTRNFRENVSKIVSQAFSSRSLTKSLGISYQSLHNWAREETKPRLLSVIILSSMLDIPVQALYESHLVGIAHAHHAQPQKLYPTRINDKADALERVLRDALNPSNREAVSLARICLNFGVSTAAVLKRFPELASRVIKKRKEVRRAKVASDEKCRELRLQQLLVELKKQGRATTGHQLRMLMKSCGEEHTFKILKLFRERFRTKSSETCQEPGTELAQGSIERSRG